MRYIPLILLIVFTSSMLSASEYSREFVHPEVSGDWNFNAYYTKAYDVGSRHHHDAWTRSGEVTLGISCVINWDTNATRFRFFVGSNVAFGHFGKKPIDIVFTIGNNEYEMHGSVSRVYVGNIFIDFSDDVDPMEIIENMRNSRYIKINVPSMSFPINHRFSLDGFTRATLNSTTTCLN